MGNYGGKRMGAGDSSGIWKLIDEENGEEEERLTMRGRELHVPAIMIEMLKAKRYTNKLPDWAASYAGMTFQNIVTDEMILFTDTRMVQVER